MVFFISHDHDESENKKDRINNRTDILCAVHTAPQWNSFLPSIEGIENGGSIRPRTVRSIISSLNDSTYMQHKLYKIVRKLSHWLKESTNAHFTTFLKFFLR